MLQLFRIALIPTLAIFTGCANISAFNQAQSSEPPQKVLAEKTLKYDDYAAVLRIYVNDKGLVNYAALQKHPQQLKKFVAAIGGVSAQTYSTWSKNEKIAFLINTYNAITLESIIDENPLKVSIKDIWGVWNLKSHAILGESLTLDTIEHKILRPQFNEPRIHAALVCAAMSCPPLRQEPYIAEKLDFQLEDQARKWMSGKGASIDRDRKIVMISSIFKWFGEDWLKQYEVDKKFVGSPTERAVLNFISQYLSPEDRNFLVKGSYKLEYLSYDWLLNRQ